MQMHKTTYPQPTCPRHTCPRHIYPRHITLPVAGLICAVFLAATVEPALAQDEIFTSNSPIETFISFITGIFAYMLLIVGLVITLGGLVLGSDMSGFARRAPLVVVAGAVLILADTVVGNLFSGSQGMNAPTLVQTPQIHSVPTHSVQIPADHPRTGTPYARSKGESR